MTKLTADAVRNIAGKVLTGDPAIIVDGIVHTFAFDKKGIEDAKHEINDLLSQLPDEFHRDKGGGWSFLNACMDRHGDQWGEHRDIELLICLGIAAGSASWLLKDMASSLPGGVPYLEVHP